MLKFYLQSTIISVSIICAALLFWFYIKTVTFLSIDNGLSAYILVILLAVVLISKVSKILYRLWDV